MDWIGMIFLVSAGALSGPGFAKEPRTCRDLDADTRSREAEIERLRTQLEEFRITDRNGAEEVHDECNLFDSCLTCLRIGSNLNCGWCFLLSRCTLEENCSGVQWNDSDAWIANGRHCPRIRKISPRQIPEERPTWLQIHIPNLPSYDGDFVCRFLAAGKSVVSKASRTENGVQCWSYVAVELPEDKQSEPISVSVRKPGGPDLVPSVNFTIYSCQNYESCTECTSSPFPCSWCPHGNRCSDDFDTDCKTDIVDGLATSRPRLRKGPEYCAKILPSSTEKSGILIPASTKKRIQVKVEHISASIIGNTFHCSVFEDQVSARILGDTMYCDELEFRTKDRNPISEVPLTVFWGEWNRLDNPFNVHALVFDCSQMASSCGACLELAERYGCGWCEETNSCSIQDHCPTSWLSKDQRCIKPEILAITPKAALIGKATNVTIEGINFGRKPSDVHVRLVSEEGETILLCEPNDDLYVTSTKISCLLPSNESVASNNTVSGFFEVLLWNQYIAVSNEDFAFVEPSIESVSPVKGTKSGGTLLHIHGRHLDAGSSVEVSIADLPCKIISRDAVTILCVTSPSARTFSSSVYVFFDGVKKGSPAYYFYVEDPWVRDVRSENRSEGPRGIPSGGSTVIVEGEHLDHVTEPPYFYVWFDDEQYIGPCTVVSPSEMKCLSPRVPAEKLNFCGEEAFLLLDYGFKMDHVRDVQNVSLQSSFKKFQMFPDPFFFPFQDEWKIRVFTADYLVIRGSYIDSVYNEESISVEIGGEKCVLTALSHSELTCRPPHTKPTSKNGSTTSLPEVVVRVSNTMEFFIGYLRYTS